MIIILTINVLLFFLYSPSPFVCVFCTSLLITIFIFHGPIKKLLYYQSKFSNANL